MRSPMLLLALVAVAVALAGCGPTLVTLRNPKTGQVAECKGVYFRQGGWSPDTDVCVHDWESRGFIIIPQ